MLSLHAADAKYKLALRKLNNNIEIVLMSGLHSQMVHVVTVCNSINEFQTSCG